LFKRQASHAFSPAKILLAISGSRDAGRAAFLPCLRDRAFTDRERLYRVLALVGASQDSAAGALMKSTETHYKGM
jgi:hypothetical protein